MRKSRFREEQIAFALRRAAPGAPVAKIFRRMGICEAALDRSTRPDGGYVA